MSRYQDHNRTRNKTVCFRLTPEEYRQMEERIKITGLPKNEFMIRSILESPRRSGRFAIRMQSTDGAIDPDYQCGKGGVV